MDWLIDWFESSFPFACRSSSSLESNIFCDLLKLQVNRELIQSATSATSNHRSVNNDNIKKCKSNLCSWFLWVPVWMSKLPSLNIPNPLSCHRNSSCQHGTSLSVPLFRVGWHSSPNELHFDSTTDYFSLVVVFTAYSSDWGLFQAFENW